MDKGTYFEVMAGGTRKMAQHQLGSDKFARVLKVRKWQVAIFFCAPNRSSTLLCNITARDTYTSAGQDELLHLSQRGGPQLGHWAGCSDPFSAPELAHSLGQLHSMHYVTIHRKMLLLWGCTLQNKVEIFSHFT